MQSSLSPVMMARSRPLHPSTRQFQTAGHQRSATGLPSATPPASFAHREGASSRQQQQRQKRNRYHRSSNNNNRTMEAPRRQSRWGDKRPSLASSNPAPRDVMGRPFHAEPRSRWNNTSTTATTSSSTGVVQTPPQASLAGEVAVSRSGIPFKKRKRFYPEGGASGAGGSYSLDNQRSAGNVHPRHCHAASPPSPFLPQQQATPKDLALLEETTPTCERNVTRLDNPKKFSAGTPASSPVSVQSSLAFVKTTAEKEDNDDKAAIVSDGPHPDSCLETSTASSSSFLGAAAYSPVRGGGGGGTADIPRQIETPVADDDKLWLHKIPRKKSKAVERTAPTLGTAAATTDATASNKNTPECAQTTSLEDFEIPRKKLKISIPRKVSLESKHESVSPLPEREPAAAAELPLSTSAVMKRTELNSAAENLPAKNVLPMPKQAGKVEALVQDNRKESPVPPKSARKEFGKKKSLMYPLRTSGDDSASEVQGRAKNAGANPRQDFGATASRSQPELPYAPLTSAEQNVSAKALRRKTDYLRVQIGARVSVFWDGENTYYRATVTRERPHKKKRFFLEYDDGDREWINLRKEKWRLLGGGKALGEISVAEEPRTSISEKKEMQVEGRKQGAKVLTQEPEAEQVVLQSKSPVTEVGEETKEKSHLMVEKTSSSLPADEYVEGEKVPRKTNKESVATNDTGETKGVRENGKAMSCLLKTVSVDDNCGVDVLPSGRVPGKEDKRAVVPNAQLPMIAAKEERLDAPLLKKKPFDKPSEVVSPAEKVPRKKSKKEAVSTDSLPWINAAKETEVSPRSLAKETSSDETPREAVFPTEEGFPVVNRPSVAASDADTQAKPVPSRKEEHAMDTVASTRESEIQEGTNSTGVQPLLPNKGKLPAKSAARAAKKKSKKHRVGFCASDWIHDDDWVSKAARKSDSDSETDDDEVLTFARQMLGVEGQESARHKKKERKFEPFVEPDWAKDVHIPISEKVKLGRRRSRPEAVDEAELKQLKKKKKKLLQMKAIAAVPVERAEPVKTKPTCSVLKSPIAESTPLPSTKTSKIEKAESAAALEAEKRRKKEEARTLTAEEIKAILGEDDSCRGSSHWVRRSARMPSRSVLNTPRFKQLIDKLKTNDSDMVVLKMKKYVSDPDCPQVCIDTVLDALEENTNCQSLYIQNFNEGMRDKQILRLLEILKKPSCNIWCLNIGETYKVKTRTWKAFTRGLKQTKITHMYASEHTISSDLKERIRATIRENRQKHNMHIDPENLDVIVRCTHCWWNPINAKVLRPHLHRKGYAHILEDGEAQGLRGTNSGASLA